MILESYYAVAFWHEHNERWYLTPTQPEYESVEEAEAQIQRVREQSERYNREAPRMKAVKIETRMYDVAGSSMRVKQQSESAVRLHAIANSLQRDREAEQRKRLDTLGDLADSIQREIDAGNVKSEQVGDTLEAEDTDVRGEVKVHLPETTESKKTVVAHKLRQRNKVLTEQQKKQARVDLATYWSARRWYPGREKVMREEIEARYGMPLTRVIAGVNEAS